MDVKVPRIGDRVTATGIVASVDSRLIVIRYESVVDHGIPNPEYEREKVHDNDGSIKDV